MSDEEKLQAIKDKSRKEKAERTQADIAKARKSGNNKKERITPWAAASLVVILALSYIYISEEPESPDRAQAFTELANKTAEYNRAAFRVAAVRELMGRGINVDDPEAVQTERLAGELFTIHFTSKGRSYRLRGTFICDSLEIISEKRQTPDCYHWQ